MLKQSNKRRNLLVAVKVTTVSKTIVLYGSGTLDAIYMRQRSGLEGGNVTS